MGKANHRGNNLFHRVIWNEPNFTDLFCNFLSFKIFRNQFINLINKKFKTELDTSSISYSNFHTEIDLDGHGRADILLELKPENQYIFEVKIKQYTSLTDKQPKEYIKYLKNHGGSDNLFFIIPKYYHHENEIKDYKIIYWEEIIELIKDNEIDKLNPFIGEFYNFCKEWFDTQKISFTSLEIQIIKGKKETNEKKEILQMAYDTNLPEVMKKINNIVDKISEATKITGARKQEVSSDFYGYGIDITIDENKYYLWFGVDYDVWEKNNLPISLQIIDTEECGVPELEKLSTTKAETKPDYYDIYLVDINEKIYDADFIDTMIKIINTLTKKNKAK